MINDSAPAPCVRHGYDVLLLGDYYCDLIYTGLPGMPRLGAEVFGSDFDMVPGAAFTTALAMHRLGLRVGWACDFGNDFFSRFVLDAVRREGIDGSLFRLHERPVRRVTTSLSFPDDRAFVSFADPQPPPDPVTLIEWHRPRSVLISGLSLGAGHSALVAAARSVGALVFMDCQCVASTLATPGLIEALCLVDIFAPNATEALQLTGAPTLDAALAQLAEFAPLVVVKYGGQGALARRGDELLSSPGIPVSVFDTTGAGDCFNAGFLYGYLQGWPLEQCLRCGNICGGLSTTARGGGAVPSAAQVVEWLRRA